MKLLLKTSLYFLTVSTFILFFGGIILYLTIRNTIDRNVDKEMYNRMHKIILNANDSTIYLYGKNIFNDDITDIKEISPPFKPSIKLKDTVIYDAFAKSYTPTRKLTFYTLISKKYYEISIKKSLNQTNDLIERISLIMTSIFILFLIGLFFLNKYYFSRIWNDFFETVEKIKKYDINEKSEINLVESYIEEFKILNTVILKMLNRNKADYINLKEFTANVSHEIQTPLAIIQSKLDILIQFPNFTEEQLTIINSVKRSVLRLSEFNKTLILLARIENNQFPEKKIINVKEIFENHLENFEDFISEKGISVQKDLAENTIQINDTLLDIMIMNLLKNAIKHNVSGGNIAICLSSNKLTISNTGKNSNIDAQKVFDRFYSRSENQDSTGLGMAIVKKICDLNSIGINYSIENQTHTIELIFS